MKESLLLLIDEIIGKTKVIFWRTENKKVKLHPVYKIVEEYLNTSRLPSKDELDELIDQVDNWPSSALMSQEKFKLVELYTKLYMLDIDLYSFSSMRVLSIYVLDKPLLKDDVHRIFRIIETEDKLLFPFFLVFLDVIAHNIKNYIDADVIYPKDFDTKQVGNLIKEIEEYVNKYISIAK